MTNPVSSDRFLTIPETKQRGVDARAERNPTAANLRNDATAPAHEGETADVDRASERMAQQANRAGATRIDTYDQARARIAQLQSDIARDPAAVIDAFRGLNPNAFAAAVAVPSD